MDQEAKYEQIEQYLAGQLSGTSLVEFENQLSKDPAFAQEVELHRNLADKLADSDLHNFRNTLKQVDQKWTAPKKQATKTRRLFSIRNMMAIAATVVLIVIGLQFIGSLGQASNEQLFAQHYEPYRMLLNQRNTNEATDNIAVLEQQAITLYQDNNFKDAAEVFGQLSRQSVGRDLYDLYTGISYLSDNDPQMTIDLFSSLLEEAPPVIVQQTRWYLGLAYLKNEDQANAKKVLDQIEPTHFKYAEAQVILSKL